MFRTRFLALAAALLCLAALAVPVQAAEVDCDSVYCFAPEDFGEALTGICITQLPDSAAGTILLGSRVLQPGDILLFCEDGTGNPTFTGIYIGNSRFVACKNKDSGTMEQALNNTYWLPRLIAARRAG